MLTLGGVPNARISDNTDYDYRRSCPPLGCEQHRICHFTDTVLILHILRVAYLQRVLVDIETTSLSRQMFHRLRSVSSEGSRLQL
jgi:hypothetical protein